MKTDEYHNKIKELTHEYFKNSETKPMGITFEWNTLKLTHSDNKKTISNQLIGCEINYISD